MGRDRRLHHVRYQGEYICCFLRSRIDELPREWSAHGSGIVLLTLAVASAVLSVLEKYRALWLTGGGALGVVIITLSSFVMEMPRTAVTLNAQLANTPLRSFGTAAAQSLQLEWGWGLLFTGGALLVVAAAWLEAGENAEATRTCPDCAEVINTETRICRFCGRRLQPPGVRTRT